MATKAEAARAKEERERRGRKPKKVRRNGAQARERKEHEAAQYSSGHYAGGVTATRNVKVDRADHETHDLEDSGSGRPSRKSTRKAAHHFKPDSQLRNRAVRRARSPRARNAKAATDGD
ncbi:MAG TPA: hypothetical protein VF765_07180 [Polyangiaceae bacterium]